MIVDYDDELLVSLATQAAPLAGVFRITASTCSLARVRRWRDESTVLRAYLSHDGAVMLADPALERDSASSLRSSNMRAALLTSAESRGGAGGARTHDRRIMRSTAPCTERSSCTVRMCYRADGARRAGIIWRAGP